MGIEEFSQWYKAHEQHFSSRNMSAKEIAHEAWLASREAAQQSVQADGADWYCKSCGFTNSIDAEKCPNCLAPRPAANANRSTASCQKVKMAELTEFQKRVLATIEAFPNMQANTWEIAWNGFAKEWNAKRSSHGAIFRCILQAGQALKTKDLIVILPPRDEHDTYTFCSLSKWKAVEHRVQPTPESGRDLPVESNNNQGFAPAKSG